MQRGAGAASRQTILIADYNEPSRLVIQRILEGENYHALAADSGEGALETARRFPGPISLLITDFSLPGVDGLTLADRLTAERPDTKVLFVSGYVQSDLLPRIGPGIVLLAKPFTAQVLVGKVRELLGEPVPTCRQRSQKA